MIASITLAILVCGYLFDARQFINQSLVWIETQGTWGIGLFIGLYIFSTVLLLPGSLLSLGAGAMFGLLWGTLIVSIASILGATLAFLIGRYLARDWVAKKISENRTFSAVDDAVGREGWKIVVLTRLSPVFPFNLLNYSFGLTKVSLKHYFFASWLGMFPGTVLYVYLGALVGELSRLGTEREGRSTGEWAMLVGGLLATILLTGYITRIAREALDKEVEVSAA